MRCRKLYTQQGRRNIQGGHLHVIHGPMDRAVILVRLGTHCTTCSLTHSSYTVDRIAPLLFESFLFALTLGAIRDGVPFLTRSILHVIVRDGVWSFLAIFGLYSIDSDTSILTSDAGVRSGSDPQRRFERT